MGRKRVRGELHVAMNGRRVGRLARVAERELRFQYDSGWLSSKSPLPISLSMPLAETPYSGDEVRGFFENLLPDNADIRQRMQRALGADSTSPFDLLAAAGSDCVGALQFTQNETLPDVRRVDSTPVSDSWIAENLRNCRVNPLGMTPDSDDFRISLAGAQEKTAFLLREREWHRPRGTTPTTHIFKLPIGRGPQDIDLSSSVENEWLCSRVVAAFGLPVAQAEIRSFEDVKALVVERFDRRWSEDGSWLIRLPLEDMCQALGVAPSQKYESDGGPGVSAVMNVLFQSQDPAKDQRNLFKSLVVFWLLAAIDGHAKNISVYLHPGGRCGLAPLYDVMSAHPVVAAGQLHERQLKMAMAAVGKNRHYRWSEIQGRHWMTTAEDARLPEEVARSALDECLAGLPEAIRTVERELPDGFPAEISEAVFEGLRSTARRA